jgi:myo-inositol-1(or 4)-monophosphatase
MTSKKMRDIIHDCEQAARLAGQILVEMQGKILAREKAPADLVTEADMKSQRAIFEFLHVRYPDFGFVGEEQLETNSAGSSEFSWIVDPLDGTTNYVHGLDNFCISIALRRHEQIVAGIVFDPIKAELFRASAGDGAMLNGDRLKSSSVTRIDQALIAASFPARVRRDSPDIARFVNVLCECQALRRMGSAALNLCYVAVGKLDGYWATSTKIWDVAAGILMIQEAGGIVSSLEGDRLDLEEPKFVTAGTRQLHAQMLELLRL